MSSTVIPTGPASVRRRGSRLAAGTAVAGFLIAGAGPSTPAAADEPAVPTRYTVSCTVDPSMLPRTADAASAWMATCYDVARLPRTPDAIEAWLR